MLPVGPQSAFGHYRSEKKKAGMGPMAKKIKGKYDDLCNKKKTKKLKKAATITKTQTGKQAKPGAPAEDWSVRRVQFEQLSNGKGKSKKVADFEEDSRVAGKRIFQHLLSPTNVDKFMR